MYRNAMKLLGAATVAAALLVVVANPASAQRRGGGGGGARVSGGGGNVRVGVGVGAGGYRNGGYYGGYRDGGFRVGIGIGVPWYGGYGYGGYPYYSSYPYYADSAYYTSPNYSYPATVSGYYSPTVAQADSSILVDVHVPPNAQVWFDGASTTQTGEWRTFVSQPLTTDQPMHYDVRARWMDNGREIDQTRRVDVRAGQRSMVDFVRQ